MLRFHLNFNVYEMLIEREACLFFTTFFTAREPNDRQTFDSINSIKFRVSLLVKHWTCQTLNECVNADVLILPIEKYRLKLNQALIFSAQTLLN